MWRYHELLTDLTPAEIAALKETAERGERNPRDIKAELGRRIVADFYSEAEAQAASDEFDRMFREHQAPEEIPEVELPEGAIRLVKLMASNNLAASVSDAQRQVQQGSVRVNGERVADVKAEVGRQPGELLIQVGKRKYLKVTFR